MASINDNVEGNINFKWTDEFEKVFCDLCIKFVRKNGRVSFKSKEINQDFESIVKRKCSFKTLKNKFDSMKRDWRIWKFLKFGETGLGWDPTTRKLNCSNEWWDRKIKEKPEAKKFRNKSIDHEIEEYWNQLFEDNYASGVNVVASSMNADAIPSVEHVNVEEGDKESGGEDNHHYESDGDRVYSQGKYYLVDKGYPDKEGYLVPYPRIRYHRSQFEYEPPTNEQKVFNRAHSSLRSCIERSFGVLKNRWKILGKMPQFSVETQIDVIMAAFALHNYIRSNSQDDIMFTMLQQHPNYTPEDEFSDIVDDDTSIGNLRERSTKMKEIRDNIANLLWTARR